MKEILESSESALFSYLTETRNLSNPIILIPKLKAGTLFEINNYKMWLSGQSGNYLVFRRATPVVLSLQDEYTLKNIFKYMDLKKIYKNATLYLHDEFNENALVRLYDVFLNKLATTVYNFFTQNRLTNCMPEENRSWHYLLKINVYFYLNSHIYSSVKVH